MELFKGEVRVGSEPRTTIPPRGTSVIKVIEEGQSTAGSQGHLRQALSESLSDTFVLTKCAVPQRRLEAVEVLDVFANIPAPSCVAQATTTEGVNKYMRYLSSTTLLHPVLERRASGERTRCSRTRLPRLQQRQRLLRLRL